MPLRLPKIPRAGWYVFGALALLGAGAFAREEENGDDDDDDSPTSPPAGGGATPQNSLLQGGGGVSSLNPVGEQEATQTAVSYSDMHDALTRAWGDATGETPTDMAVLTLMSQWALETGNGASMYNYNVGNFKHTPTNGSPEGSFMPLPTTENVNGVTQHMTLNFASYDSLDAGVDAYLKAMKGRFGQAWPDVLTGDLDAFALHLHDQGYYTGIPATSADPRTPVEKYAAGLKARRTLLASALGVDLSASPDQNDPDVA